MFCQPENDRDINFYLPEAPINVPHLINELGELHQPEILGPEETRLLLQQSSNECSRMHTRKHMGVLELKISSLRMNSQNTVTMKTTKTLTAFMLNFSSPRNIFLIPIKL
jgi:hypothetical protein